MKLTIYTKFDCYWCDEAKSLAKERDIQFTECDVGDESVKQHLKKIKPDVKTVPQIWDGDVYIGGYEELKEYLDNEQ